jgi:hypothetical protein
MIMTAEQESARSEASPSSERIVRTATEARQRKIVLGKWGRWIYGHVAQPGASRP